MVAKKGADQTVEYADCSESSVGAHVIRYKCILSYVIAHFYVFFSQKLRIGKEPECETGSREIHDSFLLISMTGKKSKRTSDKAI